MRTLTGLHLRNSHVYDRYRVSANPPRRRDLRLRQALVRGHHLCRQRNDTEFNSHARVLERVFVTLHVHGPHPSTGNACTCACTYDASAHLRALRTPDGLPSLDVGCVYLPFANRPQRETSRILWAGGKARSVKNWFN